MESHSEEVTTEINMVNWKTIAIVFIIMFIVETAFIVGLMFLGFSQMDREAECSNVICANKGANSYTYEHPVCTCFRNLEVIHTESLR